MNPNLEVEGAKVPESSSDKFFQRSLKVAPGGVHSPVRAFKSVGGRPIFFDQAEGAYIQSVDGYRYVDFCQAFGPNILGHRDPDVVQSVHHIIDKAWSMGACEPYSLELAEFIKSEIPFVEKLRFTCSGTEAVMSALRVARGATGRSRILKFDGCYHGHVDALLVKSGSGLAGLAVSDSAGVPEDVAQTTLICELDDVAGFDRIMQKYGHEIAAVIIEPLPANFGLLIQRQEFLEHVAQVAKRYGALIIFDEVISGFRVAMGGMAEVTRIRPDLVTYGKIMGGGFAVGLYGGRADLMDQVAPMGPVYQAGTLAAHPIGMVAGLTTLKKMKTLNVHSELEKRTSQFVNRLNEIFDRLRPEFAVCHVGSIFWIHARTEQRIRRPAQIPGDAKAMFASLFHALLSRSVYLPPSAYEVGFVSLSHSEAILSEVLAAFEQALRKK